MRRPSEATAICERLWRSTTQLVRVFTGCCHLQRAKLLQKLASGLQALWGEPVAIIVANPSAV
jgi:hypothetical protein